jgi:hypothetical protein
MNLPVPNPSPAAPRLVAVPPEVYARHNGSRYRTPTDLQVTPTPPARFLVVGGCLAQPFPEVAAMIDRGMTGEFVLLNNFDTFPELPADPAGRYDFQIIHLPLRSILGNAYFQLPDDGSRHEEFLHQTQDYLARYLANALKLNIERKLLTFVLGFLVPQQNPLGRYQPRYDLHNIFATIEVPRIFSDESGVARQQAARSLKEPAGTGGGSPLNESPATWMSRKSKCPSRGDSRKEYIWSLIPTKPAHDLEPQPVGGQQPDYGRRRGC